MTGNVQHLKGEARRLLGLMYQSEEHGRFQAARAYQQMVDRVVRSLPAKHRDSWQWS